MQDDLSERRIGPIAPDGVQGVVRTGDKAASRALAGLCQGPDLSFRVQPGIVAQLLPRQMLLEPGGKGSFSYVAKLVKRRAIAFEGWRTGAALIAGIRCPSRRALAYHAWSPLRVRVWRG